MLGAAVADDVMGLVVLTVVVRLVTGGSLSVLGVAWIVVVAVGFLVLGGAVGLRLAPTIFALVERFSRSTGTLVALALAFTLAFAELADAAKLAPIVGAFVAGLALGQSEQSERIGAELRPVGHLLIPIFFLQIGIDADVEAFFRARRAARRGDPPGRRHRGQAGVAPRRHRHPGRQGTHRPGHASPRGGRADLRHDRAGQRRPRRRPLRRAPAGRAGDDAHDPAAAEVALHGGTPLGAAGVARRRRGATSRRLPAGPLRRPRGRGRPRPPGLPARSACRWRWRRRCSWPTRAPRPSWWSGSAPLGDDELRWQPRAAPALFAVLRDGNARSWRFLHTTGVLERVLPELADALRSRQADPFEVDPAATHHLSLVERLRQPAGPAARRRPRRAPPSGVAAPGRAAGRGAGGSGRPGGRHPPDHATAGPGRRGRGGGHDARRRPRPAVVHRPSPRRLRRGDGPAAGRPPRHARTGACAVPAEPRPGSRRRPSGGGSGWPSCTGWSRRRSPIPS